MCLYQRASIKSISQTHRASWLTFLLHVSGWVGGFGPVRLFSTFPVSLSCQRHSLNLQRDVTKVFIYFKRTLQKSVWTWKCVRGSASPWKKCSLDGCWSSVPADTFWWWWCCEGTLLSSCLFPGGDGAGTVFAICWFDRPVGVRGATVSSRIRLSWKKSRKKYLDSWWTMNIPHPQSS